MTQTIKNYPVTTLLTISISLVFLAMQMMHPGLDETPQVLYRFGGLIGSLLRDHPGQLWRLITPIFVHIGWQHFLFNTITLFFLGKIVEELYGSVRFLLLCLLSGILGNIFVYSFTPNVIVAGASTTLFGLFAAIVVVGQYSQLPYLRQLGNSYRTLIVINLVFNLITPNISIAGHLGGLIGGALLSVTFGKSTFMSMTLHQKYICGILYLVLGFLLLASPTLL